MNFHAEMMVTLSVDIDVNHMNKTKNVFSKPYSESPFHLAVKNGQTIELSCRNDSEIKH